MEYIFCMLFMIGYVCFVNWIWNLFSIDKWGLGYKILIGALYSLYFIPLVVIGVCFTYKATCVIMLVVWLRSLYLKKHFWDLALKDNKGCTKHSKVCAC